MERQGGKERERKRESIVSRTWLLEDNPSIESTLAPLASNSDCNLSPKLY